MSEKYNGTWVQNLEKSKGFREFAAYIGMDPKVAEMYADKETTMTYANKGDQIVCTYDVKGLGADTYKATLGQEVDTQYLDGSKAKMTINLVGDQFHEVTKLNETNQCFKSVLSMDGDTLTAVSKSEDGQKSYTVVFERKK